MKRFLVNKEIYKFSNKLETPIKLQTLKKYNFNSFKNNNIIKTGFKDDLLTRLSKRIVELENLPYGLSAMESIKNLSGWYIKSFQELYKFKDLNNDKELLKILENIYNRHSDTSEKISEGLRQLNSEFSKRYNENLFEFLKINGHLPFGDFEKLNVSIDQFYTNRFSVRLLIDQYINYDNNKVDYIGVINTKTSPAKILNEAIDDASHICRDNYGDVPEFKINIIKDLTICYIPSHLYYVLFELIKNALRATMEKDCSPIEIVISGEKDVMIKISDKGKGIPYSDLNKIWFYSFTTKEDNYYNGNNVNPEIVPMAGFGLGLPVSRSIIKFLGGDLKIMSIENYGTDVYISLPKEK